MLIAFRYPSDKYLQVEELLQKAGFLPLKKGETMSDAYRKLFDLLLSSDLSLSPVTVSEKKPVSRRCYMTGNLVSIEEVCNNCRVRTPKEWLNCPEVLKALGIEPKKQLIPSLQNTKGGLICARRMKLKSETMRRCSTR